MGQQSIQKMCGLSIIIGSDCWNMQLHAPQERVSLESFEVNMAWILFDCAGPKRRVEATTPTPLRI